MTAVSFNSDRKSVKGQVQDSAFVLFVEKISREQGVSFSSQNFVLLDRVHRGLPVQDGLKPRLSYLAETGVLESISRGRGVHHVLSRRFDAMTGRKGVYTRKIGLDKETHKALLLKHIRTSNAEGARMEEFQQVLPSLSRFQIVRLLNEMREAGLILKKGKTRTTRWFPSDGES
jgi:ATP-dependent DNA helicase RecG